MFESPNTRKANELLESAVDTDDYKKAHVYAMLAVADALSELVDAAVAKVLEVIDEESNAG